MDAKDNPIRTCDCQEGEVCPHCLEEAKEIIQRISDNIRELGYKNIHYVYSGRGYHLRMQDAELLTLDSTQRTELVNYLIAAEVPQLQEGLQHFTIPFGYPRIYTNWFKYTINHLQKNKIYTGLNRQLKNDIIKRQEIVNTGQRGLVRGEIHQQDMKNYYQNTKHSKRAMRHQSKHRHQKNTTIAIHTTLQGKHEMHGSKEYRIL